MAYGSVTLNNVALSKVNHAKHKATVTCDEFPNGVSIPTVQMAPADWDKLRSKGKVPTVDVLRQWFDAAKGFEAARYIDENGVEHLPYMGPKMIGLRRHPTVLSTASAREMAMKRPTYEQSYLYAQDPY